MSNLGKIKAPNEFKELVERYEINVGPSKFNGMGAAIVTHNNQLVFTFSSTIKETEIQKYFYRYLTNLGLDVKLISNTK